MRYCSWPIAILSAMFLLSAANGRLLTEKTERWEGQISSLEILVTQENWEQAEETIKKSYQDWQLSQRYLHIVLPHDTLNDTEALYCRAAALVLQRDGSALLGEAAALRAQFRLLGELEQLRIENIL